MQTDKKITNKRRYRTLLLKAAFGPVVFVLLCLFIFASAPSFVKSLGEKSLTELGFKNLKIAALSIDWQNAQLVISGFESSNPQGKTEVQEIIINMDWFDFLDPGTRLRRVKVNGLALKAELAAQGWKISGLELDALQGGEQTDIQARIDVLDISASTIELVGLASPLKINIDQLVVSNLTNGAQASDIEIVLNGRVNGSAFKGTGKLDALFSKNSVKTMLHMSGLDASLVKPFIHLDYPIQELSGLIDVSVTAEVNNLDKTPTLYVEKEAIRLPKGGRAVIGPEDDHRSINFQSGEVNLTKGNLSSLPNGINVQNIAFDFKNVELASRAISAQPIKIAKLQGSGDKDLHFDVTLGKVNAEDFYIKQIKTSGQIKDLLDLSLEGSLQVEDITYLFDEDKSAFIHQVRIDHLEYSPSIGLDIPDVRIETVDVNASIAMLSTEPNSLSDNKLPHITLPLNVKISKLSIAGESVLFLSDETVRPVMMLPIRNITSQLEGFDTRQPKKTIPMSFKADVSNFGKIEVNGKINPLNILSQGHLNGVLSDIDLLDLTGYFKEFVGIEPASGNLNLKSVVALDKGILKSEHVIKLNNLKLKNDVNEKTPSNVNGIPIRTGLNLLQDENGNIELKLGMSGNVTRPDFDVSDAIEKALGSVFETSVVTTLKILFPPAAIGSAIIDVLSFANDKLTLNVPAINFEPGKTISSANEPLEQLAKILIEHPKVNVTVCGVSTQMEAVEGEDILESLSQERSLWAKQYIVSKFPTIEANRISMCHKIDQGENAKPRLDIIF